MTSDDQIENWATLIRGALTKRHCKATITIEQRHARERDQSRDQNLAQRHFNETAALENRKNLEMDELEKSIALALRDPHHSRHVSRTDTNAR